MKQIVRESQLTELITGKSLSEALIFAERCVQKLFWMSETISVHNMFSPGLSVEKGPYFNYVLPIFDQLSTLVFNFTIK